MSSYASGTDLWLERSRLDGMMLGAVSYGILFLLTIQATVALNQKQYHRSQIAYRRRALLGYVWITFILATAGFAGNARYTEMIWINLRNVSGGPTALILNETDYWINVMALTCYYIMEWLMQILLLHRCFVLWNWKKHIIVPMVILFLAMVSMSILVLAEASGAVFYDINYELAYLCLQVGLTIIYTLLVAGRLFFLRRKMQDTLGKEHTRVYDTVAIMVVESASLYTVLGIIFIVSFALHSNVSNLVLLSVSHVQGIAQLLIVIRVASGKAFEQTQTSRTKFSDGSVMFSNTLSHETKYLGGRSGRTGPPVSLTDSERGIQLAPGSWSRDKLTQSSGDYP